MGSSTPLNEASLSRAAEADVGEQHDGGQPPNPQDPIALDALRELILGPEQRQLAQLTRQVAKLESDTSAAGVSRLLPRAIELRGADDRSLVPVLLPAVERAIETSARANPRLLTDAVFPILGPIVRKSIASGLERMIERTRYTLAHTFSLRGLRWRMEAWLAGKTFEEVVLLHSLVYRVEQVFLIQRESGLLLMHLLAASLDVEESGVQDADLVSGMLTAIQDFVRDSFNVKEGESLESVQVGGLTVWIERGPQAVVAAVVRGNPPESVRTTLRAALESCHLEFGDALRDFAGDAAPFEGMRPHLQACLAEQYHKESSPSLWMVFVVIGLCVVGGGVLWGRSLWRERQLELRFAGAVSALRRIPGVVVVTAARQREHYTLRGLRDPDADDVAALLARSGIAPAQVDLQFAPYLSLEPSILERRIRALLRPPDSVALRLEGGVLSVSGSASPEWLREMRLLVRATPGIAGLHDEVRELLPPPDLRKLLAQVTSELRKEHLAFFPVSANLKPNQEGVLARITELIRSIRALSTKTDQRIELEIIGYADQSPEQEAKNHLGERRAAALVVLLRERGMDLSNVRIRGVGAVAPEATRNGVKRDNPENWAVGFQATASD